MLKVKNFIYEKRDEIVILTLNSTEKSNLFSTEVLDELNSILAELEQDNSVRALIITATGKVFSFGVNIPDFVKMTSDDARKFSELGHAVFNRIENARFLTIAAINGVAVGGGCEISMVCDFRIASENAKIGLPEVSLGLLPGWGGTRRLSRYVGCYALEMMLTGELISADKALTLGLLNRIISENQDLLEEAVKLARKVTIKAPHSVQFIKECFKAGITATDKEAELKEQDLFAQCFDFPDSREGMNAFIEKRTPEFSKSF